jgi:putative transposase
VFSELKKRGLTGSNVRLGIMDGLPGLEKLFREEFPNSVTQRCWVHSIRNATAKVPERLREPFKAQTDKIMYAPNEDAARREFVTLKAIMAKDASRVSTPS